jgi:hypothetical protein
VGGSELQGGGREGRREREREREEEKRQNIIILLKQLYSTIKSI